MYYFLGGEGFVCLPVIACFVLSVVEGLFQAVLVRYKHLPGLASFIGAYDSRRFQLVHDATGPVVADGKPALDGGGRTLLAADHQAGGLFEEGIPAARVDVVQTSAFTVRGVFGQGECAGVGLLGSDKLSDGIHFRGIDKGTLHAGHVAAHRDQHVAPSDQLVGSRRVQNGPRIDHRSYLEGDPRREIGFDHSGDDVGRRPLGGDDHMDPYGAR